MLTGTALVIDDSSTTRMVIARLLREVGLDVVEAENGREGLDRLKSIERPTLMVVDWNMPEVDGLSFVRAVRAAPAYDDVPVLMVTTEFERERVATALGAGANEYVMKPFTRDILVDKLVILGLAVA